MHSTGCSTPTQRSSFPPTPPLSLRLFRWHYGNRPGQSVTLGFPTPLELFDPTYSPPPPRIQKRSRISSPLSFCIFPSGTQHRVISSADIHHCRHPGLPNLFFFDHGPFSLSQRNQMMVPAIVFSPPSPFSWEYSLKPSRKVITV